jgi:PAS domain S-box-containing protein
VKKTKRQDGFSDPGALLDALPGMVYRCAHDDRRTLLFASAGAQELTGYGSNDLVGNRLIAYADLVHPQDKQEVRQEISAAVAGKRPYRCIYRLIRADGEERWVLERGRAIRDEANEEVLVGFITDHTDRMQTLQAQEKQFAIMEERNRLARELHDSISQALYSVTLFAEAGRNFSQAGELSRAADYFTDILETGQQALKEMRLLVHKLRPSRLAQEGLVRALQHRLNAVEGRAGVKNRLIIKGVIDLLPDVEEALYHITQEALNNTLKHAAAKEVLVSLEQSDEGRVTLTIQDDGTGFDLDTAVTAGGLGLTSMQERAAMIGGEVTIQSDIGQGTTVVVRWQHISGAL